uniref:Uncharacterized protein n=1 Tax=Arcella intermedia TaxID=1963864 RepID=A0A6B2KZS5_9EUKA
MEASLNELNRLNQGIPVDLVDHSNSQNDDGPLFFNPPEMMDTTGLSEEELQAIIGAFQEQLVQISSEANQELQQYHTQVKSLEAQCASALRKLHDLESKPSLSRAPAPDSDPDAEIDRYKNGIRLLNQKLKDKDAALSDRDAEVKKLRTHVNYLLEEKKALEETFQDFNLVGLDSNKLEQAEKRLRQQQQENEALQREITALKSEKKIFQGQLEQMSRDLRDGQNFGNEEVALLRVQVTQLQVENESGQVKIRRLVAAIKADRQQNEEKLNEIIEERDEQEKRADRLESRMVQLIEMVRVERKKNQDQGNAAALEEARQALKEAEKQIRDANEAASAAEHGLQQKEQELQKVLLFGKKKAREASNAMEDLKVIEDRSNKLVEVIKNLKEENQVLKSGAEKRAAVPVNQNTEELEQANQKISKLDAAVRKLRQMVSNLEAEAADKEKAYEERLKTAEQRVAAAEDRAKAAEERAKAALSMPKAPAAAGGPPLPPGPGMPPPPPPPLPKIKLDYELKITRTGQSNKIEGELGKPKQQRNVFVDSIVDAIKKGVTLKKTGLRGEGEDEAEVSVSSNPTKEDDFNVDDAFAAMAREIAMNKQKRERNKEQQPATISNISSTLTPLLTSIQRKLEVNWTTSLLSWMYWMP